MPYPGYLLNPGDMFQVEPERVLFATGEQKAGRQAAHGRRIRRITRRTNAIREEAKAKRAAARAAKNAAKDPSKVKVKPAPAQVSRTETEERKQRRIVLQDLIKQAQEYQQKPRTKLSANKKKELRAYIKELKSGAASVNRADLKALEKTVISLAARLSSVTDDQIGTPVPNRSKDNSLESSTNAVDLSPEEQKAVLQAVVRLRENPIDETKPYATPWRPRPYMSAFAFVPRYLEVNHNICSAVYLRHPVARPGLAEVPTPFPAEIQQLAFNWYLRRR